MEKLLIQLAEAYSVTDMPGNSVYFVQNGWGALADDLAWLKCMVQC